MIAATWQSDRQWERTQPMLVVVSLELQVFHEISWIYQNSQDWSWIVDSQIPKISGKFPSSGYVCFQACVTNIHGPWFLLSILCQWGQWRSCGVINGVISGVYFRYANILFSKLLMSVFDYNTESPSTAASRSQPSDSEHKRASFTLGQCSPMSMSTCSEDVSDVSHWPWPWP